MEEPINFKRLYELSIIEKEQIMNDNQKHLEKINELTKELNEYNKKAYEKRKLKKLEEVQNSEK